MTLLGEFTETCVVRYPPGKTLEVENRRIAARIANMDEVWARIWCRMFGKGWSYEVIRPARNLMLKEWAIAQSREAK